MGRPLSPGGAVGGAAGGQRSPGNGSPTSELPPSPGGERTGGYGFPALRRTLSRRTPSSSGTPEAPQRPRNQRSMSQPPDRDSSNSRPTTPAESSAAAGGLEAPRPPFMSLSQTASLPAVINATGDASVTPTPPRTSDEKHRIRLVPHLESSRSLHFEPVDRDLSSFTVLRVGRFTDRSLPGTADPLRIAFKSKVVSRGHAEIWSDDSGKFFIKDTKSSSGTFLNHIRLSGPGAESRPFPLKDGDVLQLGVDYQGGTEEIYRCVKMRIELNRGWQRGMNAFNTSALAQLRALGGGGSALEASPSTSSSALAPTMSATPTQKVQPAAASSVTDCCICLFPVTVCQALFIAPCSHVTHFKCIRPLVQQNYPGFCCPLCRTYADLEADVEIEPWESEMPVSAAQPETVEEEVEPEEDAMAVDAPASRAGSVSNVASISRRSSILQVAGADGLSVSLPVAEHRRPSHPSLMMSNTTEPPATLPLPMDIGIPDTSFEDSVYNSLAEAATPPNSMFLSTLADSGAFPRYHAPVSLGMAVDGFTNGSNSSTAGPSEQISQATRAERNSFGSEDGTDGPQDEELPTVGALGKGKRVEGRPKEVTLGVSAMDLDGNEDLAT
ncbi:E3 ubiquitin-protein ligase DMA1/2, partial [Phenoliferia sp. Uapishka_3]